MITLWQGSCNQWDCDEMGHMNVRVYFEKQYEGLVVLANRLGMPGAFRENAPSTIIIADQHVRFIREALPGSPLTMSGCVLEFGETDAIIYQQLLHADGGPAAAFRTRIVHVDTPEREAFPWSPRTRATLAEFLDEAPEVTAPRSIEPFADSLAPTAVAYDRIKESGAALAGIGAVPYQDLDVHGFMYPSWIVGRVSDSVPNVLDGWRKKAAAGAGGGPRVGGAVLEYRLVYHAQPKAGDLYELYSSYAGATGKTHALVHWMMDPNTGTPWATMQVTAITMDIDKRKAVEPPPELMAELEAVVPKGLSV